MKRSFVRIVLVLFALYVGLQLVLGSRPVQRRIVDTLRAELQRFGLDVTVESIELSTLTPKMYLNRVTVTARPGSPIDLPNPLKVDKLKIAFQPLALLSRTLLIRELLFYNPRLDHADIDSLIAGVEKAVGKMGTRESSSWDVQVRSAGVVDAVLDVTSPSRNVQLRSASLTAIVRLDSEKQQNLVWEGRRVDIVRSGTKFHLERGEGDIDRVGSNLRVNRFEWTSDDVSLVGKGTVALSKSDKKPFERISLNVKTRVALAWLSKLPELKAPPLAGYVAYEGDVHGNGGDGDGDWKAKGSIRYDDVVMEDVRLGSGRFGVDVDSKRAHLTDLELSFAKGMVRSPSLEIGLEGNFPLKGALKLDGIALEQLIRDIGVGHPPMLLSFSGTTEASGTLKPLALELKTRVQYPSITVLNESNPNETILDGGPGAIDGTFSFDLDAMKIAAELATLDGRVRANGQVGIRSHTAIHLEGTELSLTKLRHIAGLPMGGMADINGDLATENGQLRIAASFTTEDGSFAKVALGSVKGKLLYQNSLLTFDRLEMAALEPVLAHGFLDFAPAKTHYRFNIDARRIDIAQAMKAVRTFNPPFPDPIGGDANVRLTFEGGHDNAGIELIGSGKARNFRFLDEAWTSAVFQFKYRPSGFNLSQLVLVKKGGSVSLQGEFADKENRLVLGMHRFRLEDLQHLPSTELSGEANGEFALVLGKGGEVQSARGQGRLSSMRFRGRPVPEWAFNATTEGQAVKIVADAQGDGSFRAEWRRKSEHDRSLEMTFQKFDFAPVLAAVLRRDFGGLSEVRASGRASLDGEPLNLLSGKGFLAVQELTIGLKDKPMRSQGPLEFRIEPEGVFLTPFRLESTESVLEGFLRWRHHGKVEGRLDGTIDLEFLYPFLPAVDFGVGTLSAGLQLSGEADRFRVLGNVSLENGTLRLGGLPDEFRAVRAQIGIDERKLSFHRLEASVNGGTMTAQGEVRHDRFQSFVPDLKFRAERIELHPTSTFSVRTSGDFSLRGTGKPYTLAGKCILHDAHLTSFSQPEAKPKSRDAGGPAINFQLKCDARNSLFVNTDLINAEFRGGIELLGNSDRPGLLGSLDSVAGSLTFRETKFALINGVVKFESPERIAPRFSVAGRALVRERTSFQGDEYEITLSVAGVPEDYRIRLSSSPQLQENQIISLLLLGFLGRGQEGNFVDLGSAVVGQIPLQSKLQDQLGLDIRLRSTQPQNAQAAAAAANQTSTDPKAPSVQIQKDITKKTKLSYSNSLDAVPIREFRVEQILDENLTVNATASDNPRGIGATQNQQPSQSYGVDFRYRFSFE